MKQLISELNKKIIVGNSLKEIDTILKGYTKKNKTPLYNIERVTFNLLSSNIIFGSNEYSEYSLLDKNEAEIMFYSFLNKEIDKGESIYGLIPVESFSFATSNNAYEVINKIRSGKVIKERHKLETIINLFDNYLLNNKMLDNALLINKAIEVLDNSSDDDIKDLLAYGDNVSFNLLPSLNGYLTYQESELLNKLSNIYKTSIRYIEFDKVDKTVEYKKVPCFGYSNVIQYIANEIIDKKLNLNDVAIYTSNSSYDNFIKGLFDNYNIDYCFESGTKLSCEDFTQMLVSVLNFLSNHFNIKYLGEIYRSPALNSYFDEEGNSQLYSCINDIKSLKADGEQIKSKALNYSKEMQEFINELIDLYDEKDSVYNIFDKALKFTIKYCKESSQRYCMDALNNKYRLFKLFDLFELKSYKDKVDKIIDCINSIKIDKVEAKNGYVIINSINSTYLNRKYNFIIGLSASELIRNEIESPLLSDDELSEILDDKYYVQLVKNTNYEIESNLKALLNTIDKGTIYLVTTKYDSVGFKEVSQSAFYINSDGIEEKVYSGNNMNVKFEECDKINDYIYPNGEQIEKKIKATDLSPSSIESIVTCPLKYIYSKVYDDIQFDEFDNKWLKGGEEGSLAHKVLEDYFKAVSNKSYDEYIATRVFNEGVFNNCFDEALKQLKEDNHFENENVQNNEARKIKKYLLDYLNKYYNDESDKYLPIEFEYEFKNGKGVEYPEVKDYKIHGIIDRIDAYVNDDKELMIRIVDYKTYGKQSIKDHKKEKLFIQMALYPYLINEYVKKNSMKLEEKFGSFNTKDEYNVTFIYEFFKNNESFSNSVDDIKELINVSLNNYTELKKEPTWEKFKSLYNPKIIVLDENNKGRCTYCNFGKYCKLRLQYGDKKGWAYND